MPFTYCQSCGHKNLYSMDIPKFCGECGESLSSKSDSVKPMRSDSQAKNKQESRRSPSSREILDDPDGTDIYEVPTIGDFKCKVSSEGLGNRKISLGDLLPPIEEAAVKDSPNEAPKKKRRKRKPSKRQNS